MGRGTVSRRRATTRKPRCSKRLRIGPTRPRWTPSGLTTTSVLSISPITFPSGRSKTTAGGAPEEVFAVDDRSLVGSLGDRCQGVRDPNLKMDRPPVDRRDDGAGPNVFANWHRNRVAQVH